MKNFTSQFFLILLLTGLIPLAQAAENTATITTSVKSRMIGYLPGWTPTSQLPTAKVLTDAGYTDVIIAFGVFNILEPGKLSNAFSSVTKEYVTSLRNAGINVLLSIGGASSSIPNTTVSFHDVLAMAPNYQQFQTNFVTSVKDFMTRYNFNGIDIDIEHGLNGSGTFTEPQGDIKVLADSINQLHKEMPNLLIALAPQSANVSATSGFDGVWGNYSALIMQTHDALSWVGIQLYNTGCVYGIDHVCYSNLGGDDPNFSVALAVDLLESWPKTINGNATGFQPYISYLKPEQVVLGYPAPNAKGISDGSPQTSTTGIKNAISCLKTGNQGCAGYKPPRAYGTIGGVFNWEITYDQNNGFKFAKGLKACLQDGQCG